MAAHSPLRGKKEEEKRSEECGSIAAAVAWIESAFLGGDAKLHSPLTHKFTLNARQKGSEGNLNS